MLTVVEKEEIVDGFDTLGRRVDALENNTKSTLSEVNEAIAALKKYHKNLLAASMQAGSYKGFWQSEEQAKDFGRYLLAAAKGKALGEGSNPAGGAIVPIELAAIIIDKMGRYGKFRKNAAVLPVHSSEAKVPKIEADLTIYAPGEGNTIADSDMEFSQVGIVPIKMACLCKVSSELDEDSVVAVGETVGVSMARSMSKKEDQIGFVGNGTATYFGKTGIVHALRAVDDTIGNIKGLKVGTGNAYSELTLDDFEGAVSILPDDADEGAKWYVNRKFFFSVMHNLARDAGAADMFAILSDRKARYFMGYEVEFVSAMPSTEGNSQICALLGDLSLGAYLAERREMEIARSNDVYFANDQVGIRGTERVDFSVFGVGDTAEAGPIVGLITAAS